MKHFFIIIFCLISSVLFAQSTSISSLKNKQGAAGPDWGPYSSNYAGISHIADSICALRFDFSVFLAHYRGKIVVPNQKFESDWYPWRVSADLNYFSFREELEWKDKVFADIEFVSLDKHRSLMKVTITNNLADMQSLALHFMSGMQYPYGLSAKANLPAGRKWISAIDYMKFDYARPRPDDNLITDGLLKGEIRSNSFVGGSGLGFRETGDSVTYNVNTTDNFSDAALVLRYKLAEGEKIILKSEGVFSGQIEFVGTGKLAHETVKIGALKKAIQKLTFTALTNTLIELDGFALVKETEVSDIDFDTPVKQPVPVIEQPYKKMVVLKYGDVPQYYGLAWNGDIDYRVREILTDEWDNAIRTIPADNIYPHHYTRKDAHTTNVFLRTIQVPANSKKILYAVLMDGTKEDVLQGLEKFPKESEIEQIFKKYNNDQSDKANPKGSQYTFSKDMLTATTLQNIIYPIYTQRQFTKQFVPGKRWNSLYTWDNGFTGIGMANVEVQRAIESLQIYTTDTLSTNAFTHHGSPVGIQFFLYKEIWDKTQSKELLAYFYPRMKKYYQFFVGEYGSSTTRKLSSGLLNTFDYFYNSGGWDDYPAQEHMHEAKLAGLTAPIITSSMAIRMAKIMSHAAHILNKNDISYYQKHIDFFSNALQKYSWDEKSGYFGYVVHNKTSKIPEGILRTKDGVNYNMGIDGFYPLIAGICTPEQRARALDNIFSPQKCWTDIGISAVDQSAPYFSLQGYWNGAVWFPHQWIIWKTMFDEGEADRASQIALTALDLYKKEVDSTYFTAEIFRIETKRGNGWKQFGALSSPILSWYSAYFQPGIITTGFDTWIKSKTISHDKQKLNAKIQLAAGTAKNSVLLVCMPEGKKYNVTIDGKQVSYTETIPGALQVLIESTVKNTFVLSIEAQ